MPTRCRGECKIYIWVAHPSYWIRCSQTKSIKCPPIRVECKIDRRADGLLTKWPPVKMCRQPTNQHLPNHLNIPLMRNTTGFQWEVQLVFNEKYNWSPKRAPSANKPTFAKQPKNSLENIIAVSLLGSEDKYNLLPLRNTTGFWWEIQQNLYTGCSVSWVFGFANMLRQHICSYDNLFKE